MGAELEVQAVLGNLRLNGGAGWLDAEFAENTCINDTNAPPGTDPGCPTGNRQVGAGQGYRSRPNGRSMRRWNTSSLFGNGVTLTPRVQYSHVDQQYATPFPSAVTIVPERDLWDLRLTYKPTG